MNIYCVTQVSQMLSSMTVFAMFELTRFKKSAGSVRIFSVGSLLWKDLLCFQSRFGHVDHHRISLRFFCSDFCLVLFLLLLFVVVVCCCCCCCCCCCFEMHFLIFLQDCFVVQFLSRNWTNRTLQHFYWVFEGHDSSHKCNSDSLRSNWPLLTKQWEFLGKGAPSNALKYGNCMKLQGIIIKLGQHKWCNTAIICNHVFKCCPKKALVVLEFRFFLAR